MYRARQDLKAQSDLRALLAHKGLSVLKDRPVLKVPSVRRV